MSAVQVAGAVRARSMLSRCLAPAAVADVAASTTLRQALARLTATPYRHDLAPAAGLAEAQRSVAATLLWHLRVLAGWQSRSGAAAVRLLASGFEIVCIEAHARALQAGVPPCPPYRLGTLNTAWRPISATASPGGLRSALAASAWGDPGAPTAAALATSLRVSAAQRIATAVPGAAAWASGRLALLVARETYLMGREVPGPAARRAARTIGPAAMRALSYGDFVRCLPVDARWAVSGIEEPGELWRAELRWWDRVERDGRGLLRRAALGFAPVLGAVALLSVNAWRVRAALELAARGGGDPEALDAVD
ncbi:hypothetical protein [Actinacidiphila glaucinigra]|uniref:hypothetical protein n=1 Tax=Actinacidiphila glaucinigra TaxID=235986 RepID=UPI0037182822